MSEVVYQTEKMSDLIINVGLIAQELGKPKSAFSITPFMYAIYEEFGVTIEDLASKCRSRKLVCIRQLYLYHYRTNAPLKSLKSIGDTVNRDHSTVLHSMEVVSNYMEVKDEAFMEVYNQISKHIKI
jgi:chromosomal replication initiator protein